MRIALLLMVLLLVSCRKDEPAAPTPEQSSQLNDADSMLNNLANEEGPADQGTHQSNTLMGTHSTGPSNSSD